MENPHNLRLSLDSIYTQTIIPNEVILIKDGPLPDDLNSIIREYQTKYTNFKDIQLKENLGLGRALNEGLKHCSYDLIARMDTDDIAKPDRFEKQIKTFKNDPSIDVCSSWIDEFEDSTENILAIKKLPKHHDEISKYAKHRCPINHPAVMYKKSAVLSAGGYSGFPEDYCLWIKMLMNGAKFHNIQESLLFFRFSREVIKRRGGWNYAKSDVKSQYSFYKMGFISFSTLIYNIFIRVSVRLMPNQFRSYIYLNKLRKNE